jgi:hypothetical protein
VPGALSDQPHRWQSYVALISERALRHHADLHDLRASAEATLLPKDVQTGGSARGCQDFFGLLAAAVPVETRCSLAGPYVYTLRCSG